jgi:hypothetical protein
LDHFERAIDGKREKEIKFGYKMRRALSKIKFNISILREVRKLYTTKLFDYFKWSLICPIWVKYNVYSVTHTRLVYVTLLM